MLVHIESFPEIWCWRFEALQDDGVLLGSFPDRVVVVHRHESSDSDAVPNNIS